LQTLSADEVRRSQKIMRREDYAEFITAHGVLRHILSRYCGVRAVDLRFLRGATGKPFIERSISLGIYPHFNMAHSAGRMLLAIHGSGDVGIDLECEQDSLDPVTIAARYLTKAELKEILASPDRKRRAVFLRSWVAKEAVLKACGVGLGYSLDRVELCWASHGNSAAATLLDSAHGETDWTVCLLTCEPGWHAAVAARSGQWTIVSQTVCGC